MAKYVAQVLGKLKEISPITSSAGAGDASKIAQTDGTGRFDSSLMPIGFGSETKSITASEALSAGDFVNIHNSTGLKVRKADASSPSKQAHGFVLASVSSGAAATVYYGNLNTAVSGLTVGDELYLSGSTPGGVTATPPSTAGHIVQRIGVATTTTEMLVEIDGNPVELA
jgi:hypothetical protein